MTHILRGCNHLGVVKVLEQRSIIVRIRLLLLAGI